MFYEGYDPKVLLYSPRIEEGYGKFIVLRNLFK